MERYRRVGSGRDEVERAMIRFEELMFELDIDEANYSFYTNSEEIEPEFMDPNEFYELQLNIVGVQGMHLDRLQMQLETLIEDLDPDFIITDEVIEEETNSCYIQLRRSSTLNEYVCDAQITLMYRP